MNRPNKYPYTEELNNYIDYLEEQVEELRQSKTTLSQADIRNRLSPIKNIIAFVDNGLLNCSIEASPFILREVEQCKKEISYLSKH